MKDTPNGFAVFAYKNIALEIVDACAIPIVAWKAQKAFLLWHSYFG